jgi:beta-glucosidase
MLVTATYNNTIVITHSGGINTMLWADKDNATAIISTHFSKQEIDNSIVDVL